MRACLEGVTKLFSASSQRKCDDLSDRTQSPTIRKSRDPFCQVWRSAFASLAVPSAFVMRFREPLKYSPIPCDWITGEGD